jgi:phosphomannomutase
MATPTASPLCDELGEYIPVNEYPAAAVLVLARSARRARRVVRNLATTHLLDRLAAHFNEKCYETSVGFKHSSPRWWRTIRAARRGIHAAG